MLALVASCRCSLLLDPSILVLIQGEGLPLYSIIDFLDELHLEVLLRIDTLDHLGEVNDCHAALGCVRVVKRCLHHHRGVGEKEDALSAHLTLDLVATLRVVCDKLLAKALHHSVNDLTLAWQAESEQYCS